MHDRKRSRKKPSVPLCHRETAYRSEREHTIDLVSQKFAKIAKSGDTNHSGKRVLRHNGLCWDKPCGRKQRESEESAQDLLEGQGSLQQRKKEKGTNERE